MFFDSVKWGNLKCESILQKHNPRVKWGLCKWNCVKWGLPVLYTMLCNQNLFMEILRMAEQSMMKYESDARNWQIASMLNTIT